MMQLPWRDIEVSPGKPAISTSLTGAEISKLQELAEGQLVLDIGTAYGYSAIAMAQTAKHVFTIDPHVGENVSSLERLRANLAAYNATNVTPLIGYSQDILPVLSGLSFGLVFIDGSHQTEAVRKDYAMSWPLVTSGCIACHDYGEISCPGVKEALDSFGGPDKLIDTLWIAEIH